MIMLVARRVLVIVVCVAGLVSATHLHEQAQHDAERQSLPPSPAPADARVTPGNMPDPVAAMGAAVDQYLQAKAAEDEAHRQQEQAAADEAARQAAAQQQQQAAPRPVASAARSGSCNGDVNCFLPCTRAHESDSAGGYAAVSPNGQYRGAYQFAQATWNAAVAGAGHAEYVGVPPDQAPPAIQDAAAAHLYSVSGNGPWEGRC